MLNTRERTRRGSKKVQLHPLSAWHAPASKDGRRPPQPSYFTDSSVKPFLIQVYDLLQLLVCGSLLLR